MDAFDAPVHLTLPHNHVGQILDGLEVLIEQWEATATYFRTGEVGDTGIRECSDAEEADWTAGYYEEIAAGIRAQLADQTAPAT
jgi:hypothetical protein